MFVFVLYLLKFKIDLNRSFSRAPFYRGGKVTVGKDRVYVNQMRRTVHRVVVVVVLRLSTRNDVKQTQLETNLETKSCDLSQVKFTTFFIGNFLGNRNQCL